MIHYFTEYLPLDTITENRREEMLPSSSSSSTLTASEAKDEIRNIEENIPANVENVSKRDFLKEGTVCL